MIKATQDHRLNVAGSPHWRDGSSQLRTQLLILAGLAPAVVASLVLFGLPAARVIGLAVAASVLFDAAANRLLPSKDYTTNWSSVSLGILLAFLLPLNAPWWLVTVGAFLTIVIGKKLFGGWGGYPVHPVALSYAMLTVSWPARLDYTASLLSVTWPGTMIEPLRLVKTLGPAAEQAFSRMDLLLGHQVAGTGSGLVLWLLLGGLLLLAVRQVPWQIPGGFLLGAMGCAALLRLLGADAASPLFQLLAGGTVLAAFHLAPEHTTSPINPWPMLIYGLLGGILLVLIRTFSTHVDGTLFTILLINICAPLLDRIRPKVVGLEVSHHA